MRHALRATIFTLIGFSLQCGCAVQSQPPGPASGGGGSSAGADGGAGGSGGSDCVAEVCDGEDNDCDGAVDEDCECVQGEMESCYSGPAGTAGVGSCMAGVRACDPAAGMFGPCVGEIVPAAEVCNGRDEDCNGQVDDGLPDLKCGVGACAAVAPACVDGKPGKCVAGLPSQELCDGIDNDCNQLVDETFPQNGVACDTGLLGICATGVTQCVGAEPRCVVHQTPAVETCDGVDDDCDGVIDDGVPGTGGACSTGALGVCGAGTISCRGGVVDCFPSVEASPEVCDGADNDCDGDVDEGCDHRAKPASRRVSGSVETRAPAPP